MPEEGLNRPRIALALGGGGALGIAHVGVLKVLSEFGIRPDFVAGTSAGAMVGATYCAGVPVEEIARHSLELSWRKLRKRVFPAFALYTNEPMIEYLQGILPVRSFAELTTPLRVVATDLCSAQMVIIEAEPRPPHGELWRPDEAVSINADLVDAVRASCTVPVAFKPVELAGRMLVDGGLVCNVPAAPARQMGADVVIAVDLASRTTIERKPTNILQYIIQASAIRTSWAIRNRRIYADIVLQPDLTAFRWDRFRDSAEVFKRGEAIAREKIGDILLSIKAAEAQLNQQ